MFIPQVGRIPGLIFDFTWSGLNDIEERLSPMEVMRFRGVLLRILKKVLTSDRRLGPVYISKVDLADAYMKLCVRMEDAPSVAFLIPKKTPSDTAGGIPPLPPHGVHRQCPLFLHSDGDDGRPRKRGHIPEGAGRRAPI